MITKEEALTALKEGRKVTRQYFGKDEHIWMDESGTIRSEEGYDFTDWWYDVEPNIQGTNKKVWTIIGETK